MKSKGKLQSIQKSPSQMVKQQNILSKDRDLKADTASRFGWMANSYWSDRQVCIVHDTQKAIGFRRAKESFKQIITYRRNKLFSITVFPPKECIIWPGIDLLAMPRDKVFNTLTEFLYGICWPSVFFTLVNRIKTLCHSNKLQESEKGKGSLLVRSKGFFLIYFIQEIKIDIFRRKYLGCWIRKRKHEQVNKVWGSHTNSNLSMTIKT